MRFLRYAGVAGLVLVLAACPDQDDRPATDPATDPAVDTRMDPAAAPAQAERVELRDLHGTGVTGEAMVTPRGNQTHVVLTVQGARPNQSLPAHIHAGRCDTQGPVVEGLESVQTDQTGQGRSESTVGVAAATVFNGQHFINVHESGPDGQPGTPVACADLPERRDLGQPGMQADTPGVGTPGRP